MQKLVEAGIHGLAHLAEMSDEDLRRSRASGPKTVEKIREAAALAKVEWDARDAAYGAAACGGAGGGEQAAAEQAAAEQAAPSRRPRSRRRQPGGCRTGSEAEATGAEAGPATGAATAEGGSRRVGRMANVRVFG